MVSVDMLFFASFSTSAWGVESSVLPESSLDAGFLPRSGWSSSFSATIPSMVPLCLSTSARAMRRGPSKLLRLVLNVTREATGVADPDDCLDGVGRRSGLGALLGAAVERAVTGTDGIVEQAPGVGGSVSAYVANLEALLRSGLGALLDAAVESAVGVKDDNKVGVENPVSGNDNIDPCATWRCAFMDVLWRVSSSLIHCATGKRWTEERARMSTRVSCDEARADSMADLNCRTRCFGAMDCQIHR